MYNVDTVETKGGTVEIAVGGEDTIDSSDCLEECISDRVAVVDVGVGVVLAATELVSVIFAEMGGNQEGGDNCSLCCDVIAVDVDVAVDTVVVDGTADAVVVDTAADTVVVDNAADTVVVNSAADTVVFSAVVAAGSNSETGGDEILAQVCLHSK